MAIRMATKGPDGGEFQVLSYVPLVWAPNLDPNTRGSRYLFIKDLGLKTMIIMALGV